MDRARDRRYVIECDILAGRLPWLGDSNNSLAIVEAHFIQSLHDVLEPTNAGDQTFFGRMAGLTLWCKPRARGREPLAWPSRSSVRE